MSLLDIVFHQSNEYLGSNPSDGFLAKLFLAIVGSLIGFGTSFYLFYKKLHADKIAEDNKKEIENDDLLNYFATLSSNIVKKFKEQASLISPFVSRKRSSPFDPENNLGIKVNRDVDRIQKLDQERIIKAFYARFGKSIKNIHQITEIYSYLDFLFEIKYDLKQRVELDHKIDMELSLKFAEFSSQVAMECADIVRQGTSGEFPNTDQYSEMWKGINSILIDYHSHIQGGITTIPISKQYLIDPLRIFIVDRCRNLKEPQSILKNCKYAGDKHKEIEVHQRGASQIFSRIEENINEMTRKLEPLIPKLSIT